MAKDFKFFKGYTGTLNAMDEQTHATASFNDDTPEGHMNRRMLYHTNRGQYDNLRDTNNEMGQYFYNRSLRHNDLTVERIAEITRRINGERDLNGNPIRLFKTTSVTTVNPNWKTKIKMFFQEIKFHIEFNSEIVGIIVIAGSLTVGFILIITKLLNAW